MLKPVLTITMLAALQAAPASALDASDAPRLEVGQCVRARIAEIGSRLVGEPDSGTSVLLTNGIASVSYEVNEQANRARVGDEVIACLVSKPPSCPKADDRGQVYTVVDLRTRGSWTLPNAEHICGGA